VPRRSPIDPEGYSHVSTRGNFGEPLFQTNDEHRLYLELYAKNALRYGWLTLAWSLMWNHHHFLIKLTNGGLSEGMRGVNHSFSRRMNAVYGRTGAGHLVRHCFYAGEIQDDNHLAATSRYIDLNAVAAKLCKRPEDWPWSGYRATVGLAHAEPFHTVSELHAHLGSTPASARSAYRRFVLEGIVLPGHVLFPGNGYESVTPGFGGA